MGKTRESANLVSDINLFSDIVNDRVGIGIANPQEKLDVNGNANIGGKLNVNGNFYVTGVSTFIGNIVFGDTSGDNVVFNADVNSNIIPNITNTYDLGSITQEWRNAYFAGSVNSPNLASSLRSNRNITGGGTITVDLSGNVLWTSRFIVISNGRGANFATSGYFDINCPTSGTITGVGGASNKTATAAGIPLGTWEALYYILPIGSGPGTIASNFRVVNYTADVNVPHDWVLICVRNSDNGSVYFNNGIVLQNGESMNGIQQDNISTPNTLVRRDSSGNFSANVIGIGTNNPNLFNRLHIENGNVLLSNTSTIANQFGVGPYMEISGRGNFTGGLDVYPGYTVTNESNISFSASQFVVRKTRVDGAGNREIALTGDTIGEIIASSWSTTNGGQFETAAYINFALNDNNITGSGNHPSSDIGFFGRPFGQTSQYGGTEHLRIKGNYGYLLANTQLNGGGGTSVWGRIVSNEDSPNVGSVKAVNTNASVTTQGLVRIEQVRAANSTSFLIYGGSSASPSFIDSEFYVRSDGNAFADGTWAGGGADYAEMFEWLDGNPDNEDRRGITVVLETNKIRPAEVGEDPIGVISANPVVLGDSGDAKWHEKHLRDDFGSYIWEPHEVIEWTGENGKLYSYESHNIPENIVIPEDHIVKTEDDKGNPFTHRKINPLWDPNLEYIPRENRPEWSPVGLMGKLRIRRDQPTGLRWIKMRDISEEVEEWLVR